MFSAANRLIQSDDAWFITALDSLLSRRLWLDHRSIDDPKKLFYKIRFTIRRYTTSEERYKILPICAQAMTSHLRRPTPSYPFGRSVKRITPIVFECKMIRAAMEVIKVTSSVEEAERLMDKVDEILEYVHMVRVEA